jgi:hypothetical protein
LATIGSELLGRAGSPSPGPVIVTTTTVIIITGIINSFPRP